MHINKYLKNIGMSQDRASKYLDITAHYMNQICLEKRLPSRKLARKIQEWTNGAVTISDMIPEKKLCPCCGKKLTATSKKSDDDQEDGKNSDTDQDLQKAIGL